jgi:hypothetical protein
MEPPKCCLAEKCVNYDPLSKYKLCNQPNNKKMLCYKTEEKLSWYQKLRKNISST